MSERISRSFHLVVIALMLISALVLAAMLLLAVDGVIEKLLLAGAGFFLLRWAWSTTRRGRNLSARGFHAGQRVGTHWVYEELRDGEVVAIELTLTYVGRGDYEIHIPDERTWQETMPSWAQGRRDAIIERLGTVFKRSEMRMHDA